MGLRPGIRRIFDCAHIAGGGGATRRAKWGADTDGALRYRRDMVTVSQVIVTPWARRYCAELGVDEDDLRAARAAAWSLYEDHGWLACRGRLPTAGREAIMFCRTSTAAQVETFRLVD